MSEDTNQDVIRNLLAPFVDAGTKLTIEPHVDGLHIKGTRRFQDFDFPIVQREGGNLVVPRKRGDVPLGRHLASGAFGDLDRLARSMLPFLKSRLGKPGQVVEGLASFETDPTGTDAPAQVAPDAVTKALYSADDTSGTTVTFLHGDAGAGKSWLLMKIALDHAKAFLERKRDRFSLYVDAQGVNLRSLSQQIAHQLDIYNGVLRYTEVPPLVRLGTLGLIIDGFDELIMPSGYNDTLRALMSYIEDFRGEGALVASARTSFLHAYASAPPSHDPIYPYRFSYLRLRPWTREERQSYARKFERPDLASKLEGLAGAEEVNGELLGRPFLVAHVFDRLVGGAVVRPTRLLETVEDAFLERERTRKLLDVDTGKPLLSREQFIDLLEEIAEEMWVLRQNSLDRQTTRTVASILAESFGLDRSARELVEQKIDIHSFLEPESGGRIRFPHEIIFSRILARRLLNWVKGRADSKLRSFLRVAPLKVSMAEQFVSLVSPSLKPKRAVREVIDNLSFIAERSPRSGHDSNVLLNLGSLVAYLLPYRLDRSALRLSNLHFAGVGFRDANLVKVQLTRVWAQDIDARGADWTEVQFDACFPVGRLMISEGQKMPFGLPPVSQLEVIDEFGRSELIYGTQPTRQRIFGEDSKDAEPKISGTARAALELLRNLCLKVQQGHHWIPLQPSSDDLSFRNLRRFDQWDVVIDTLEELDLLYREKRSRSGPNPELAHVRKTREILAALGGEDPTEEVRQLLSRLQRLT